jgi:hypothetical protein
MMTLGQGLSAKQLAERCARPQSSAAEKVLELLAAKNFWYGEALELTCHHLSLSSTFSYRPAVELIRELSRWGHTRPIIACKRCKAGVYDCVAQFWEETDDESTSKESRRLACLLQPNFSISKCSFGAKTGYLLW